MKTPEHTEGFTLFESLVAFAILAMTMIYAMSSMSESAQRTYKALATAKMWDLAEQISASKLLAPVETGQTTGRSGELEWRSEVVLLSDDQQFDQRFRIVLLTIKIKNLRVQGMEEVTTHTFRLMPANL